MSVNLYHKYVTEDVYTICEAYHCYVLEYSIYIYKNPWIKLYG